MAGSTLPSLNRDLCQAFKKRLAKEWRRKAACNRYYIDLRKLTAWMERKETDENMTNTARLLREVHRKAGGELFQSFDSKSVLTGTTRCLLIFGILLEIDHGDLIEHFQSSNLVDNNLADAHLFYPRLRETFKERGVISVDRIIGEFERVKWQFCPVEIKNPMRGTFHGGKWVLPFCKREEINQKGGTAELFQVSIQEDLVPLDLQKAISRSKYWDPVFGWCYQLALKSYPARSLDFFNWEKKAFAGIQGRKGMVKYLGEYSFEETPNDDKSRTYNILLEYGELDLDEFFADDHSYPPVRPREIINFWRGLFKVAEALKEIHNLEYEYEGGYKEVFHGWHADLKPDNILRVHGEFKLADFGFAKFKAKGKEIPMEYIEGGTETYGPPETDRKRRGTTRTPVMQTIDTWSFGCVLSITATWIVLGQQGISQYETLRKLAIRNLRERQKKGEQITAPTADDAFHDGDVFLPEISSWHEYLRSIMRESDVISRHVLELVEDKMLCKDPKKRVKSDQLCHKLDDVLTLAEKALEKKEPGYTDTAVLEALWEFDTKAPSNAAEAAKAKATPAAQQKIQEMTNGNVEHVVGTSLTVPKSHASKSKRLGKSARLDNIPMAKTAQRAELLEKELNEHRSILTAAQPAHISNDLGRAQDDLHTVCESPIDNEGEGAPEPIQAPQMNALQYPEYPARSANHLGQGTESYRRHGNSPVSPLSSGLTEHAPIQSEGLRHELQTSRNSAALVELPSDVAIEISQQSSPLQSHAGLPSLDRPSKVAQGKAPIAESEGIVPDAPFITPPSSPDRPPMQVLMVDPSYDICVTRQELERNQRKGLEAFIGRPKKDFYLKKFITNRDIKFVVDNGTTMYRYHHAATFVLETLAMKLAGLDDDGLDLLFTIGSDKVENAKGSNAPKYFKKAMERSSPIWPERPHLREKTDMSATLGHIFDEYLRSYKNKRMTLIVLTDGIWEGSIRENGVDEKIADFVRQLLKGTHKMEDRRFSIEFVRFGSDPNAMARLKRLDDELEKKFNVPDIIDTVPWTGKVKKMILGSFSAADDEDEEQDEDYATVTKDPIGSSISSVVKPFHRYRGDDHFRDDPPGTQPLGSYISQPPSRAYTNQSDLNSLRPQQKKKKGLLKFL